MFIVFEFAAHSLTEDHLGCCRLVSQCDHHEIYSGQFVNVKPNILQLIFLSAIKTLSQYIIFLSSMIPAKWKMFPPCSFIT